MLCFYWYSNFGVCAIQEKSMREDTCWLAVSSH